MTDVCTVRVNDKSALAVGFVVANWLDGWPSKTPDAQSAPITSMGVDYTAVRIARYDYPVVRLAGLWAAGDFEAAVNKAAEVRRMRGRLASVQFTAAGKSYDWSSDFVFLIHNATATPRAGQIIGNGVSASAHLECSISLQLVPIA
jgi:hypothetical protein